MSQDQPSDVIALFQAAALDDVATIRQLVADGLDPNTVSEFGSTPLHNACIAGCVNATQALLCVGADPNQRYTYRSPVDGRIEKDIVALMKTPNASVAQTMVEHNADPNLGDHNQNTPLMYAAKRGHREVVRVLLSHGADRAARNKQGHCALDLAKDTLRFFRGNATGFASGHAEKRMSQIEQVCRLLQG